MERREFTKFHLYMIIAALVGVVTIIWAVISISNIQEKENANRTHYEVGKKVRKTIKELGGTMPEDLPTPQRSIKQIESQQKIIENKNAW